MVMSEYIIHMLRGVGLFAYVWAMFGANVGKHIPTMVGITSKYLFQLEQTTNDIHSAMCPFSWDSSQLTDFHIFQMFKHQPALPSIYQLFGSLGRGPVFFCSL